MTHYVCTGGCGGTSDHPQSCQTESCSLYGQPMKECHCQDGKHQEAYERDNATKPE